MGHHNIVFTEITPELLSILKDMRGDGERFIDCGAGVGMLGSMLENVVGIDILPDPKPMSKVEKMDSTDFDFEESDCPIFIRPCQGDWVARTIKRAFNADCRKAIVITKPCNVHYIDVVMDTWTKWKGPDGERIYIVMREDHLPKIKTDKKLKIHLYSDPADHEQDTDVVKKSLEQHLEEYEFTHSDDPDYRDRDFDVLVFDWGGMSMGNSMMEYFSSDIIKFLIDKPSKYLIVLSNFTEHAVKEAVEDLEANNIQAFYSLDEFYEHLRDLEEAREEH